MIPRRIKKPSVQRNHTTKVNKNLVVLVAVYTLYTVKTMTSISVLNSKSLQRSALPRKLFWRMVKNRTRCIVFLKKKPITKRNPKENIIVERVHQTIDSMIISFEVQEMEFDETDPWNGMLTAVAFVVRSIIHTISRATPMHLVFDRDTMLNIPFIANWKILKGKK